MCSVPIFVVVLVDAHVSTNMNIEPFQLALKCSLVSRHRNVYSTAPSADRSPWFSNLSYNLET